MPKPAPARAMVRPPRLVSDQNRVWISVAASFVFAVIGWIAMRLAGYGNDATSGGTVGRLRSYAVIYFGYWVFYCVIFSFLTYLAFRQTSGRVLHQWLRENETIRRRRRLRQLFSGDGGPSGAVAFSATAVGAVVIVAALDVLRGDPLVVGLATAVVAATWLLIVMTYATHYAREYVNGGGLKFPTEDESQRPELSEFVYLSVQVATSFATSDVTVVQSRMRRVVTGHSVVAFAFNTVIVALLVSVLISTVT